MEVGRWVFDATVIIGFIAMARAGEFRRVWNRPMRAAMICWGIFAALGWLGPRLTALHMTGRFVEALGVVQLTAVALGMISLVVVLVGLLGSLSRDLRPENRAAVPNDPIDTIQQLIADGKKTDAARFYQEQNHVSLHEAEDAIHQIDTALKAGLRI
jgi:hypothetical protein